MFWEPYFYTILTTDFTVTISNVECGVLLHSTKDLNILGFRNKAQNK